MEEHWLWEPEAAESVSVTPIILFLGAAPIPAHSSSASPLLSSPLLSSFDTSSPLLFFTSRGKGLKGILSVYPLFSLLVVYHIYCRSLMDRAHHF